MDALLWVLMLCESLGHMHQIFGVIAKDLGYIGGLCTNFLGWAVQIGLRDRFGFMAC